MIEDKYFATTFLLVALIISHVCLYHHGYIDTSKLVLVLLSDAILFAPVYMFERFNIKSTLFTCAVLLLMLNSVYLNMIDNYYVLCACVAIFAISLHVSKSLIAIVYLIIVPFVLLGFDNPFHGMLAIDELLIYYHPSMQLMLFYIPLMRLYDKTVLFENVSLKKSMFAFAALAVLSTFFNQLGFAMLVSMFIRALIEEVLYRAWIFHELSKYRIGPVWRILISSVIFALVHIPGAEDGAIIAAVAFNFVFGLVYATVYYKTKNVVS
jgi:membrane protease YdiL (CAAX protease family)